MKERDLFDNDLSYDVPHADGKRVSRLDMTEFAQAESRLCEVASCTSGQAQELLSFYNDIWLKLDRIIKTLVREKGRAEAVVTDALADATLACTDAKVLELGHKKTSADLRKAIADKDERVIKAREILSELEAVIGFLRSKAEAFYRAHHDVKNLRDGNQLPRLPLRSGGMPEAMGGPAPKQSARPLLDSDDPFGQNEDAESVPALPKGFSQARW